MKFHIIGEELYYGKYRVGHVTYIDYRDNGRHGYSIWQSIKQRFTGKVSARSNKIVS